MQFHVGQKVVFLNEVGGGVIVSIENGRCLVEDELGFKHPCLPSEIALVHSEAYKVPENHTDETTSPGSKKSAKTGKRKLEEVWEIDLHIEEIVEFSANMTNGEIVQKQLHAFRQFYSKAKSARIRKIVIIHGVGEGVLRSEVRSFLDRQDGIEYYDADYRKYGRGATAIEFRMQ